jgi:taurine--2-oxoglutarate transaminase
VAALESYLQEDLIRRSRTLGASMLAQLKRMQQRHELIGEARGGHGLFAVLELVRDRITRAPIAPWPELHPALRRLLREALRRGVSFAARGNLLLLAPPLVIRERELTDALDMLDGLLGELALDLKGSQS